MMDPRVFRLFSFVTESSTVLMFLTRTLLVAVSQDPIFHSCFCFCATTCDIMTLVYSDSLRWAVLAQWSQRFFQFIDPSVQQQQLLSLDHQVHTHTHGQWIIFPSKFKTLSSGWMQDFLFRSASRGLRQKKTGTF